jgi:hypothetical protein
VALASPTSWDCMSVGRTLTLPENEHTMASPA